MRLQSWLHRAGLTKLKLSVKVLETEWDLTQPDRDAAWELYVEMLTRIVTQPLSVEMGDELAALASVHSLFGTTREILRTKGRYCIQFTKVAIPILNGLTPPDVEIRFFDDRIEPIPFDAPTDLVAISVETYTARRAYQIASASPERFLKVRDRWVEARPIKGTRPRARGPEADLFAGDDLRQSPKDRAENVMIVDLLRNDLSRVCDAESVHVTQLCGLEVYRYVQHLVSAVCGRLRDDRSPIELVRAAFPGGSVTGAPKLADQYVERLKQFVNRDIQPPRGAAGYQ